MTPSAITETLLLLFQQYRSISTDTRRLKPGDLYFALKGGNFDGNTFAAQALATGASFAIVDDPKVCPSDSAEYILVPDVLEALQSLATAWRRTFSIPVLGITGSNGKTTTKELVASVLRQRFRVHATTGNLNNHIGVPLTLLSMPTDTEIAIIEMGANKPGDIQELCDIAEPTHGLITNIGKAHLEQLGGIEGVSHTKGALFRSVRSRENGFLFINAADTNVQKEALGPAAIGYETSTYGAPDTDVWHEIFAATLEGMAVILHRRQGAELRVETPLSGAHNGINLAAAAAVGMRFSLSDSEIKAGLEAYRPTNNRSQLTSFRGVQVWQDAYNANPSSMRAAIQAVMQMAQGKRVLLVLGDMFELGEHSRAEHQALCEFVNEMQPAAAITVGLHLLEVHKSLSVPHQAFATAAEAKTAFLAAIGEADLVMLKGSRGVALEQLLQ